MSRIYCEDCFYWAGIRVGNHLCTNPNKDEDTMTRGEDSCYQGKLADGREKYTSEYEEGR